MAVTFAPDTIGRLLLRRAQSQPDDLAIVFPDASRTFREIADEAMTLARALMAYGVKPGEAVALLMPNCLDLVRAVFAISLAGGVVVPINARYKRRELGHVVAHSDAVMLMTTDLVADHVDFLDILLDAVPGLATAQGPALSLPSAPRLRHVVLYGKTRHPATIAGDDLIAAASDVSADEIECRRSGVSLRDDAVILYTSGTTQLPKGCVLTHEAVTGDWAQYAKRMQLRRGDRMWAPCPMFHMSGLGPLTAAVGVGATTVSSTHFTPDGGLQQLREHRLTHLHGSFPQITNAVLLHPDCRPEDLSCLQSVMNVATPEQQRQLLEVMPPHARLVAIFGMTEGTGAITITEPDDPRDSAVTTCGRPIDGVEVRIVDPNTGATVTTPHSAGEIQFRGFNAFVRYHRDPELTAETIDPDGWVKTGDLGQLDGQGRLSYASRLKDMLKVGGENIAAMEIESHLESHPSVKLAQVVGRPDERYGEVPVAFVELRPGAAPTTEQELIDYCVGQLASFKVPREVRFITEWPMSATKVQKFKLRQALSDESVLSPTTT